MSIRAKKYAPIDVRPKYTHDPQAGVKFDPNNYYCSNTSQDDFYRGHCLPNYNWLIFKDSAPEEKPTSALPVMSLGYRLGRASDTGIGLTGDHVILWALV